MVGALVKKNHISAFHKKRRINRFVIIETTYNPTPTININIATNPVLAVQVRRDGNLSGCLQADGATCCQKYGFKCTQRCPPLLHGKAVRY